MGDGWFCEIGGRVIGPLLPQQLRTMAAGGQILPTDRVRRGNSDWTLASHVHGLFPAAPEPPPKKQTPTNQGDHSLQDILLESATTSDESEEESLLSSIPLKQTPPPPKKPLVLVPDPEEYTLAPLPTDKPSKTTTPPKTDTPPKQPPVIKEKRNPPVPGAPSPRQKPWGPSSDTRNTPMDNTPLDLGMGAPPSKAALQAGAGTPTSLIYARHRKQQQQRLFVSLAVIGVGVAFALMVLVLKGCGNAETKPSGEKKPTTETKKSGDANSTYSLPTPLVPVPKDIMKDGANPTPSAPPAKPVGGKAAKRVEADEPLTPATGSPENDFGIKPEDAVPLPSPQPVQNQKNP